MISPAALHAELEARHAEAAGRGVNAWSAGAGLVAARLGMDPALALAGVLAVGGVFARLVADPADPRRLKVAEGDAERAQAQAALVVAVDPDGVGPESWVEAPSVACGDTSPGGGGMDLARGVRGPDLVAWSLTGGSRRVWRWTLACPWLGEIRPDTAGVVRLWQDPHLWLRRTLAAAAWDARARAARAEAVDAAQARARLESGLASFAEAMARPAGDVARAAYVAGMRWAQDAGDRAAARFAVERRMVDGALVLDPAAIPWTRAGALAEAEAVEICDAPVDGPLGRALAALNPRLGTPRGVPLRGVEVARAGRGARGQGRRAA